MPVREDRDSSRRIRSTRAPSSLARSAARCFPRLLGGSRRRTPEPEWTPRRPSRRFEAGIAMTSLLAQGPEALRDPAREDGSEPRRESLRDERIARRIFRRLGEASSRTAPRRIQRAVRSRRSGPVGRARRGSRKSPGASSRRSGSSRHQPACSRRTAICTASSPRSASLGREPLSAPRAIRRRPVARIALLVRREEIAISSCARRARSAEWRAPAPLAARDGAGPPRARGARQDIPGRRERVRGRSKSLESRVLRRRAGLIQFGVDFFRGRAGRRRPRNQTGNRLAPARGGHRPVCSMQLTSTCAEFQCVASGSGPDDIAA